MRSSIWTSLRNPDHECPRVRAGSFAEEQRRKTKLVDIRLYEEEYDLISAIAQKKKASRSFVAESLIRAAIGTLKEAKNRPPNS